MRPDRAHGLELDPLIGPAAFRFRTSNKERTMRILLIEDDLACARSIEAILVAEGCSVHHAELAEDRFAS